MEIKKIFIIAAFYFDLMRLDESHCIETVCGVWYANANLAANILPKTFTIPCIKSKKSRRKKGRKKE